MYSKIDHNVGGLLMFVWVWNTLVTYHDVPDLHVHEHLHEYMYVRMLGCMSTPLYVHVCVCCFVLLNQYLGIIMYGPGASL